MAKIPHIIHYCWFGKNPMPRAAEECMASWRRQMPEWEIRRWDEGGFDIAKAPLYVRQAYDAKKYAFVSDYVRLWALEKFGGLYMDVDFMVYRPFDELMDRYSAFAGYEGSKRQPVMMGVIASEPHGAWVKDMLGTYQFREFIKADGSLDLTPNTSYFTDRLISQGFVSDGEEKDFYLIKENENTESAAADSGLNNFDPQPTRKQASGQTTVQSCSAVGGKPQQQDSLQKHASLPKTDKNGHVDSKVFLLHVFPVHYFCPVLTTGEDVRTEETYCEHMGESSWTTGNSWKARVLKWFGPKWRTRAIKLKRKLFG